MILWAARRSDIVFIASGSATSWMVDNLIENQGGLHARITSSIYVRPFTLNETEEYLQRKHCKWDRYQILQCYMVFGGIPCSIISLSHKTHLVMSNGGVTTSSLVWYPRGKGLLLRLSVWCTQIVSRKLWGFPVWQRKFLHGEKLRMKINEAVR